MNTEKILEYVQRTKVKDPANRYTIYSDELSAIYSLFMIDPFRAIGLTFEFGKAKGYRLARSEKRKGGKS